MSLFHLFVWFVDFLRQALFNRISFVILHFTMRGFYGIVSILQRYSQHLGVFSFLKRIQPFSKTPFVFGKVCAVFMFLRRPAFFFECVFGIIKKTTKGVCALLEENNINFGLVKPLLKAFPVSGEVPAALSYLAIEEYPLHTQLHMEVVYVAKGSLSVKVGVSDYILHAGEFAIINPLELHGLYAAGEPNQVCILEINQGFYAPCKAENIFVSAYALYEDAAGKDFFQIKNLLHKIFALHLSSRSGERPDVLHLPASVTEDMVQYEKILLRSLINYFELHFTHEYFLFSDDKENTLRDSALQANRLKSILLYFYENFPQKIQLQDVADVTFTNRYSISRLVKSGVGVTFSELLQHIRVEKSELYLLGTQMPVSQIVYELGFSSYRYFSLHFKKVFHMAPAAYRKKFTRETIRYKNVTAALPTTLGDVEGALALFSAERAATAGEKCASLEKKRCTALEREECAASMDDERSVSAGSGGCEQVNVRLSRQETVCADGRADGADGQDFPSGKAQAAGNGSERAELPGEDPPNGIKGRLMKINHAEELGRAIKRQRKALHYTQAHLAEVTGFSVTFISDVERGKPTAEFGETIRLANFLGLDLFIGERG